MQHLSYFDHSQPSSFLEERPLPKWPKEVFPSALEEYIHELARFTETPVELSAMLALSVLATTCHNRYQVQIKDGYVEPINLWTLGILPPASRKSSVYRELTAPLKEWERKQRTALESTIKTTESNRKTLEARLKALRAKAAHVDDSQYSHFCEQIASLEGNMPEIPSCPQLWASDVTNEQLAVIMAANNESMSLLSDEGGIFDIMTGLYSDGRCNIDLLLQAHSGCPVKVDRGSRPPIFMERAVLTMGLTAQPSVMKKISSNKIFRGRGLLGRFLYVIPKSNIGFRTLNEPPISKECKNRFQELILASLYHTETKGDKKEIYTLKLSLDAYDKWLEYAQCIEKLMGDIDLLSHITDWAGKLPGAIARIAGLLHIAEHAYQAPCAHDISPHNMACAIKIGHVLIQHALVAFDLLQEDEARSLARMVNHWIKEHHLHTFTLRECKRKFRRHSELIPKSLDLLEEAEIITKIEKASSIGRHSIAYAVVAMIDKGE